MLDIKKRIMSIAVLKIMIIFAVSSSVRAVMPDNPGNFYFCPQDTRRYPCRDYPKGIQSPDEGLDAVKGNAVYFVTYIKNFVIMNNSLHAIKAIHQVNRPELIQKLLFKSKDQLIQKLLIELNAKNRAYYFILESGLLEQFHIYCREEER